MNKTINGTVKWFNDAKGYGFLSAEGVDDNIFVHYSAINHGIDTFKTLKEDETVEFELVTGPKGPQAFNVTRKAV